MNKHLHRIVFNAARGTRMVVQETARSAGKAGSGATGAVLSAAALASALMSAPLHAQIVADPGAPGRQRPTVLVAPNGVPLVNIQTPSAAGVSRNTYSQFDVQRNGAILNNSRGNAQTQLGGWVQGNPWLATGSARVIVNEVNSANPSQLRGYVEVAGPRTEVIIANPAGIQVDGGGFINVNRATLTTGTPQFNAQGGLDSFVVRGGSVSVDGAGFDATKTDYAAILARAVQVNAGVWANELKVVTGANQVSADSSQSTPTTGSGATPSFALDVAALGGMYAGKITLVGTEAGVGVRNAGHIGAGAGGLVVTAAGRLENTGTLEGAKVELSSAADIDNRGGTIRQAGTRDISVTAPVLSNTNGGVIGAELVATMNPTSGTPSTDTGATGTTTGTATGTPTTTAGITEATPLQPAVATGPGAITAAGSVLNDGGRIYAGGEIALNTPRIDNTGGSLSVGTMAVTGDRFSNAGGTLNISRDFSANVGAFDNSGGTLHAGDLRIQTGGDLINRDGTLSGNGDVDLAVGGNLHNTAGTIVGNEAVQITTGGLTNEGGKIHAAGSANLTISVNARLTNRSKGEIGAGGNTTINAGVLDNDTGRITAVGDLRVTALGAASNRAGTLAANRNATLDAASFDNGSGSVDAVGGDLAVTTTGATVNQGGKLQASGAALLANGGLDNTDGQVIGGRVAVDTQSNTFTNVRGTLAATATTVDIQSGALNNTAGLIQSKAALTLDTHGRALTNANAADYADGEGGITSAGAMTLHTGAVDNSAGFVGAAGALMASSGEFINGNGGVVVSRTAVDVDTRGALYDNRGGQTLSTGDLVIAGGRIDNEAALIRSGGNTTLSASSVSNTNTQGSDQGIEAHNLSVTADTLTNTLGAIRVDADATIASAGTVDNATGLISAKGALRISDPQAGTATPKTLEIVNTNGTLKAGERVLLDAAGFSGDGTVVSDKDLSIALSKDVVNNGTVSAAGALSYVTTGTFTNNSKLYATQMLSVGGADVLNNAIGEMSAGQKTVVSASGTLTNRGLIDSVDTQVNAGTLDNLGTGRIYGDRISLMATGTLNNGAETVNGVTSAASIASRDTLHIGAKVINNSGHAQIFSVGNAAIGGALDGNRQAVGQAATLTNSAATIDIGGNLRLAVDQVNNLNPSIRTEQVAGPTQKFLEYAPAGANDRLSGGTYDRRSSSKDQTYAYYTTTDGQRIQAKEWTIWDYERNTAITQVVAGSSDPGQILVGGDLNYSGNALRNQASKIVIGGALTGNTGALKNEGLDGVETTTDHGTAIHSFTKRKWYSGSRRNRRFETVESYDPAVPDRTFTLKEFTYEQGQKPATGKGPDGLSLSNVTANTATAGEVNGSNRAGVITEVATGVDGVVRTSLGSNGNVPTASLFRTASGGHYLVETDPRFAGYRNWLSSDYLLNALGQDPNNIQKRLGDGFYEQKLIREQIAQLTGYRYLDGFESDETQYTALMNAGVTFAQAYGLRPGIGLSAAQMAQLTSDIVWLVEQTVTLADGSTQRVLVPQVYVRVKPGDIDGGGALLSANELRITNAPGTGNVTNTGTLAGRTLVAITADNVDNLGGRIVGGSVGINARNDLNNIGGSIEARNAAVLTAGHDINIRTTTSSQSGAQGSRTAIDRVAGVYVTNPGGTLVASAGHDVNLIGAILSNAGAGGTTSVKAVNDIHLGTVKTSSSQDTTWNAKNFRRESQSAEVGSTVATNGTTVLNAGNDIAIRQGAVAAHGTLAVLAGNDVNIESGSASQSLDTASYKKSSGFLSSKSTTQRDSMSQSTVVGSSLSGQDVVVSAGNDLTVSGSQLTAQDQLSLSATRDVRVQSAEESSSQSNYYAQRKSGFSASVLSGVSYGKSASAQNQSGQSTTQVGSTLSGGNVSIDAGRDAQIIASAVVADKNVAITAGRNIDVLAAADTQSSTSASQSSQTSVGLVSGIAPRQTMYGSAKGADNGTGESRTAVTSLISANSGNLTMVAGLDPQYKGTGQGNITTEGADLLAKDKVALSGNAVNLNAATSSGDSTYHAQSRSVTLGSQLTGVVGSQITRAYDMAQASKNTSDSRLKGAQQLKAGYDAYKLATSGALGAGIADAAATGTGGDPSGAAFGVSVSISSSKNRQDSAESFTKQRGTNIQAGSIDIMARESDITMQGAKLQARDIALDAQRNINLIAAQNTAETHGSNSGSSLGAGVTAGFGSQNGISFQLSASSSKGKSNGSETSYDNTLVTATDTLKIRSGGDTNLIGAQLAADRVKADIGGNLNIQSLQDRTEYESKQSSGGIDLSICVPPICYGQYVTASANYAKQSVDHNYQSATGQSGIAAGRGGFDITVKGNTDLQGGAITSTAPIDKNSFTTGSLTTSDLTNRQNTDSRSESLSVSYGSAASMATNVATSVTNTALGNLNSGKGLPADKKETSQTLSVISPSNVKITGTGNAEVDAKSAENVATLTSRDATTANGALVNNLTLQQAQDIPRKQQEAQAHQQAAQLVGSVISNAVGDVSAKLGWEEGSAQKIALHGLAGLVQAKIGDGSALAGAAAGMANEALLPAMESYLKANGYDYTDPSLTPAQAAQKKQEFDALLTAGSTLTGAAVGAVAGGSGSAGLGAVVANNATVNNRLLHEKERSLIATLAKDKAKAACNGDGECEAKSTTYWTDLLERTAKGLVDDKANAANQQYIATLLDTARDPNSEGARGGVQQYLSDANQALGMLAPYAGQTILTNGLPSTSYGAAQTYFSATPEQRADPTVNTFLGSAAGPIAPGMALRDEARIERLAAINGSAQPVYPVEEALLGGAILNRAMAAAARAVEGMDVLLAGKITPSSGGNISAQKITLEAVPAKLTSGEVSVLQKIDSLPNTTLQGDAREYVSNSYFMRNGYTPLDGKCGSNCFDGIYTKNGQVFVAEVKPLNADGTIQLNGPSLRADGSKLPTQMSKEWIDETVETLKNSKDPALIKTADAIIAARKSGNLVKVVTGVNQNGMVLIKLK